MSVSWSQVVHGANLPLLEGLDHGAQCVANVVVEGVLVVTAVEEVIAEWIH